MRSHDMGRATWLLDLLPQHGADQVLAETRRPRGHAACPRTSRAGWASPA